MEVTEKLKPYPAYKPSGVEWIGEIPEHWDAKRLKYISTVNDETLSETTDLDLELVYVDIGSIDPISGIKKRETLKFDNAPSRARRKVRDGDVIISTVRTYLRAISPINDPEPNMIVSTGFAVIRPKEDIESQFAAYSLRAPYFVDKVVANSVGVSYPAINASELITFNVALPPLPEQRAIAAFLDRKTQQIDTLIEKKQRQIGLLKEQHLAVINQAVTKGLDPDVQMKDSGIEWLEEIPEHWEVKPLKYGVRINRQSLAENVNDDYEIQYIDIGNVNQEGLVSLPKRMTFGTSPSRARRVIKKGDTIVSTVRTYLKAIAYINSEDDNLIASTGFSVLTPTNQIHSKYLYYLVSNQKLIDTVSSLSVGVSYPAINSSDLGSIKIWFPNSIDEQQLISTFLDNNMNKIYTSIKKQEQQIQFLQEYRTALISEAVTGKIDLRGQ